APDEVRSKCLDLSRICIAASKLSCDFDRAIELYAARTTQYEHADSHKPDLSIAQRPNPEYIPALCTQQVKISCKSVKNGKAQT
ncbi:hypothetical protein, partial [Microcoleus sp. herbarium12]|uniref:hypothetical protein n=1 Tax=Microcoleus sp. herbarium12 TaxID=3055437 RepID=UPI002FD2A0AE